MITIALGLRVNCTLYQATMATTEWVRLTESYCAAMVTTAQFVSEDTARISLVILH